MLDYIQRAMRKRARDIVWSAIVANLIIVASTSAASAAPSTIKRAVVGGAAGQARLAKPLFHFSRASLGTKGRAAEAQLRPRNPHHRQPHASIVRRVCLFSLLRLLAALLKP